MTMRLLGLEVRDVRGIRELALDLDADIVVLRGENGEGKSSILQAIEWCLYGERMEKKTGSGITARVEPALREVFLGAWEGGRLRAYAAQQDPIWLRVVADGEWGHIPGAESSARLQQRCVDALQRLHAAHPGQRVVCVVHGGVIGTLAAHAVGARHRSFDGADNGSLHSIVVLGTQWWLRRFNDTAHLDTD